MAIFWGSPEARIHRGTAAAMDTVDYTDSTAAVHIDMAAAIASGQRAPIFGGYAEGDRFISIEGVWGSRFADTITGNSLANAFAGYGGSDRLRGAAGNDTLRGEGGGDTVWGGAGDDLAYGDDAADQVWGGDGADALFGGPGVDTLSGDDGVDTLYGGKGDDVLIGGLGRTAFGGGDWLEGGAGADTLYGDTVKRNAEGDVTGPGDLEDYAHPAGGRAPVGDTAAYTLSNTGVVVDLSGAYELGRYSTRESVTSTPATPATPAMTTPKVTLKAAAGGHAAGDVLYGIVAVRGSAHNDTLVGGSSGNDLYGNQGDDVILDDQGDDWLFGGKGNDTLISGAGDDHLIGGAGADILTGGAGSDGVSYLVGSGTAGVSVDLSKQGTPNPAQSGGHAEGDTLSGIEQVHATNFSDFLVGDSGNNILHGYGGDDWDNPNTVGTDAGALAADGTKTAAARGGLFGGAGDDILNGGDGQDLLAGEAGADTVNGQAGNDYLHGGADNDTVNGGAGDDTLTGGAGNDNVSGGDGNDWFLGEAGTDTLSGGAGTDTFDGRAATSAVTITLQGDIENYLGGSQVDTITAGTLSGGVEVANHISGGGGNDVLSGLGGNDTLSGGLGEDTLTGGAGNDTFVIARETGDTATTGRTAITVAGITHNRIADFRVGDKIDIRAVGVTAAELATLLRGQGQGQTKNLDFGTGKGWLEVFTETNFTGLTAADFII